MHHAIEWPDLIGAATGDAQNIGDEILHRARCTDAIQRAYDKEGIAHPAKSIVPVASRSRDLGNGGGQRRHDSAGLLVIAQLQCDGRADDLVLPVNRKGQPPHPLEPIVPRAFAEIAARTLKRTFERLVSPAPARVAIGFLAGQGKKLQDHHLGGTRGPLHSHLLTEQPRLFFMHFWANGSTESVAQGIKAALSKVHTK